MNRKSLAQIGTAPTPDNVARHQVVLREMLLRVLRRGREEA